VSFVYDLQTFFAHQIQQAEKEAGKMFEPVIGVVTDNKDPSKLGRVKLKIPILSGDDSTFWAPIIMQGASKNRGWFFIPEKDDEVLVLFEHGDMQRPVVVSALWNGTDKPPDKNGGGNPRRMIKSRQGSKITFDDEKNMVVIEDGTGKGKITIDADNNKIIIESIEGDVCFQSPQGDMKIVAKSMELKAQQNLEIHAGQAMQLGTDASVTIDGGSSSNMSGSMANANCGSAQMPQAPTTNPQDVADPYGS
jgi:uncharacterized protein involved in type VI secretion and phage assembly